MRSGFSKEAIHKCDGLKLKLRSQQPGKETPLSAAAEERTVFVQCIIVLQTSSIEFRVLYAYSKATQDSRLNPVEEERGASRGEKCEGGATRKARGDSRMFFIH